MTIYFRHNYTLYIYHLQKNAHSFRSRIKHEHIQGKDLPFLKCHENMNFHIRHKHLFYHLSSLQASEVICYHLQFMLFV